MTKNDKGQEQSPWETPVTTEDGKRSLRNALGQFATGVAVITSSVDEDNFIGLTVNSFSSVSLDPPLILWSLADSAASYDFFEPGKHFVVNILSADQKELAWGFAQSTDHKFSTTDYAIGEELGQPVLAECMAYFGCKIEQVHLAGDHNIVIGRVLHFSYQGDTPPLLFHSGKFLNIGEEL